MIGNITLGGLAFVNVVSDEAGSKFRETSRGASMPTEIIIKHSQVVDSRTKRPATQSAVTVNRYDALADGSIAIVETAYMVVRTVLDSTVSDAEILLGVELLVALLTGTGADANALNKRSAIFVTRDQ
jgi:hypothetical protein